ncbi:MAG: hypothetical protein ABSF98_01280 [Bryobacteraceae bacterium]|jgi:GTPase SAR1 family protein
MPTAAALEPVTNDPLLTRTPLEYEGLFYPYEFPVRIRSNSPITLRAAEVSWGTYKKRFDTPPLDVRLLISESSSPGRLEPPVFRSQGHLLSIAGDSENFACLDLRAGFSFGWVTSNTAANTEYFRQCFLDVMIYPLIEIRYLVTVHAACVIYKGKGILLAGDSGAGKSSLAYACARRQWTYVSDDASAFVRASDKPTIIGHPQKFRFREPVGELFPEFRGLKSSIRAYGKPTIEIRTKSLENLRTADQSAVDAIVFLNRGDHRSGPPVVRPVPPEEVWKRFSFSVWSVQMPEYRERLAAVEGLIAIPAWEMCYGDLDAAIDLLETLANAR